MPVAAPKIIRARSAANSPATKGSKLPFEGRRICQFVFVTSAESQMSRAHDLRDAFQISLGRCCRHRHYTANES